MRLLRLLLASVIVMLFFNINNGVIAQTTYLTNYVVDGGNPGGISTLSDANTTGTAIITGATVGNSWSPSTAIGFPFSFYGTPVTNFKVSGNGVVTFTTTATAIPSSTNTNLPAAAAANIPDLSILGFWDAFTGDGSTASGDNVYVTTVGTAPNRQLWISYYSYEYGDNGAGAAVCSFAYWSIVLEETTNKVYIVDKNYHSGGANLTSTIGVQQNATSAVQYGTSAIFMGAGSTGTPDNDYYEFTPVLLVNNNAGVSAITSPVSPLSTGVQNVNVTLKNHGLNALTSATINWKVNGTLKTPYSYTGNLAQNGTASITLGTHNFISGTTNIVAWTSMPNGVADNDVSNDTSSVSLCTSLSGTYTIGAGGNYTTVSAAVAALNSCGISGPVTFNVAAGTYTGAILLNAVTGASATNTITFNGAGAATTTITHDGTGQYATISINGADYVTFKNLTIANTATTNGFGVLLTNQADNNTIDNCIINLDQTVTASTLVGVLSSGSTTSTASYANNANNTKVINTTINGGYYGVRYNGASTAATYNVNNSVENCTFNNIYFYSVYWIYQDAPSVKGCTIGANRSTGYAIYSTTNRHMLIQGNTIATDDYTYAIYFTASNGTAQNGTARASIINNMIGATGIGDGIYITGSSNFDIFYNSVTAENDQALWLSTTALGYNIRNNIFATTGTAAPIDFDAAATATDVVNYNVYYNAIGGNIADIGATSYPTLVAWKAANTVQNINSLEGDPSFFSSTNLHVAGTIANNVGTPIAGITTDIDGQTRNATTPDIGADEYTPPSCAPPGALTAAALATTANLGWTLGGTETMWDVEYGAAGFTQGTGTSVTATTSNPYTATGLTPNSAYQFYVRANCGGGNGVSPWIGPFSFSTACVAFTAPFTENFDGLTTSNLPSCWAAQVGPDLWNSITVGTTSQYMPNVTDHTSGSGQFKWIDASSDITANEMVTPLINMSGLTTPYAGFWFLSNNTTNAINHTIALDAWNGTAWVNVTTATGNFPTWVEVGGTLPVGVPTTTKFRIYAIANPAGTSADYFYNDLGVDDFFVMEMPSCLAATNLAATNITTTSASLGWTANGTATTWNIEYGAAGFTQGSGTTVSTTTNPHALTGLSANTTYSFYVQSNCGGSTSAWAGPFTFSTPCVAYTVPYFEGFETGYTNGAAVAGCISQQSITGTGVWTANNTLTTYNRAPYAGAWNAFLQYGNEDWLYFPITLTGGTSYTFEAYARQDGATATNSDVTIKYGTANNAAAMTNTIVAATGIIDGAYQQITGSFTPTTTGTYYIGIKGYMNSSPWYISLDNISVITTPNCPAPNTLTASNIAATSASLAWVGTGASFQVQYGVAGFTPGAGMMVTSTTNTASLTGLTFETNYNFYVRAICAPGDTSPWSGSGSFFTGYCTPAPISVDLQGITNVSMGGVNNTTVAEPGNYGNYSAQVANAPQGGTLAIDVTYQTGYTYDTWAWVDWNNDLDFTDAGEEYYLGNSTTANPTTLSGSIAIPATAMGNYRIRIGGSDTGLPTSPADPCYSGAYAAFEDYTLNVAAATPALMPFALLTPANNAYVTVAGPAQNPIDISWESAGVTATMYEWRAVATGGSLNSPLVTMPSDNMGMDTTLSLNVQAVDDLLASLGVAIGDTAVLDWSVMAYTATGDSLLATMPYTVNLVRLGVSSPLLLNAPQNTNSTTTLRAPNGSTAHTYMRAATVVLPTEFATAGIAANTTIRNFGFNVNGTIPAGAVTGIFKLYLQNTTAVTYGKGTAWSGITPGMTEVFNDTITINGGGAGWDVVLDTLFAYAGNSVYVAYDWQLVANPLATAISYMANTALAGGLVSASSATVPPVTLAGSAFRPEFSWGIDRDADDLEVVALYAMGKNPLGYSQAEQVQAIVRNNGYLPANKTVSLNITGANPYTTSENVTLAPGQETTVSFMAYNPTTAGFNNMTVTVPADQVTGNNTQTWVQQTTTNTFSYADSVTVGLGGVGYNTGSGLLLNRYYVNGAASINEIKVRISTGTAIVGNAVYAVLMDTSGAIVSQSAPHTVAAADLGTVLTFNLPTTINVNNVDIFVGLAQPANATTGYFPVAFQSENPTRPNAYYTADLNGANVGTVAGFRLMIEAVVTPTCASTSAVAVTNAGCFGSATGSIAVTVTGGVAPYTYAWSNNQTTATATGLTAAVYTVTITDANGCSLVNSATVGQPAVIVLAATSVPDTSNAGVGSASVVATGGTAPYTYAWSGGQTTATATGLVVGTYTVTVTDANGCTKTQTATITNVVSTKEIEYLTNLSIYPNPTSNNAVINLELSKNADVAISIYTVTGILVQDFGKENTSKATHIIDVTEYPAGMYLVRFVVDSQVITKKLLVTK